MTEDQNGGTPPEAQYTYRAFPHPLFAGRSLERRITVEENDRLNALEKSIVESITKRLETNWLMVQLVSSIRNLAPTPRDAALTTPRAVALHLIDDYGIQSSPSSFKIIWLLFRFRARIIENLKE